MGTVRFRPYRWNRRSGEQVEHERRQPLRVLTPAEINQRFEERRQQTRSPVPVGVIVQPQPSITEMTASTSVVNMPLEVEIHTRENDEVVLPDYEDSDPNEE